MRPLSLPTFHTHDYIGSYLPGFYANFLVLLMVDGRWLWCCSGVNETHRLRIYTSVYDDDDSRMPRVCVYWQYVRPSKRFKCLRVCVLCSVLLELVLCVHMCVFILPLYRFSDLVLTRAFECE